MPLNAKGHEIMAAMKKQYGEEEGERVFYASKNAGTIEGVDAFPLADADADGHVWSRGISLSDTAVLDSVRPTRDGYLACEARVARVGTQRYRGREVGIPDAEWVTLNRPEEEVFARDALHSMANKPVTLTHPKSMVDKRTWGKVAKGFSGNEVVRDGEYVRVPLMLTDAAAIDAYQKDGVRELSVGYTTDIDWSPGRTANGEAYDGVQRQIRCNHHALVPVARGGSNLRLGDVGGPTCPNCGGQLNGTPSDCPTCGYDLAAARRTATDADPYWMNDKEFSAEERKDLAEKGHALPGGGYPIRNVSDLENAIKAFGRAKNPDATKALIKRRAKELGAESKLPEDWTADAAAGGPSQEVKAMPIIRSFDGIPISFADEISAATMEREMRKITDAVGKYKKLLADKGNGDDDDADAEMEREKKERGYKDAISAKDGEIAVLKKQLADAGTLDARAETMAEMRISVLDSAKDLLPQGFKAAGQSISQIRRAAVTANLGDATVKDWDDAKVEGAFVAMVGNKAASRSRGSSRMADGMSREMATTSNFINDGRGGGHGQPDYVADAEAAYAERMKELQNGYKTPISYKAN